MRRLAATALVLAALGGCSSSSSPSGPALQPARTYRLAEFQPAGPVQPGQPTTLSFTVDQPSGAPLTRYRTGPGPHTGVHLILVRDDLTTIIHDHPPIGSDGRITQSVTFPEPGPYRLLVDVYPSSGPQPNFQLFKTVDVTGSYASRPIPPFRTTVDVGGYRVTMHGKPKLRAIQAAFLTVTVTDASGRPAKFTPWFGALAHAIFFRAGSLAYFHTHVCGANTPACSGAFGGVRISGHSSTPGKLSVGVLLPQAGTWRLFLQCKVGGKVLTAPFTLRVR
jgi:hypothetical protein